MRPLSRDPLIVQIEEQAMFGVEIKIADLIDLFRMYATRLRNPGFAVQIEVSNAFRAAQFCDQDAS